MDIRDTKEYVRTTLQNEAEPLWFPRLAKPLARIGWDRLQRETGLNPKSYSTTKLLLKDPYADHRIAAHCKPNSGQDGDESDRGIPVEILTPDMVRQITDSEIQLLDTPSTITGVARQLDEALSLLNLVPTVWPTVRQLVRALHVIDSGDNDTDVSFSDPSVPFSIFVSVPPMQSDIVALRIAEAILHESMHLHLSLVSQVIPLVWPQGRTYYSPWRDEERDSEGIIQALYVFGVIRSFFAAFPVWWSAETNDFVRDRKGQIESEIKQTHPFDGCDELTPDGAILVARLLNTRE